MKTLSSLCLLLVATPLFAADQDFMGWRVSDFKEKSYHFKITKSAVEKSPKWKKDQAEPPLSPKRASAAALAQAKVLRPEVTNWNVSSISLTPLGRNDERSIDDQWIYMVALQDYSSPIAGVPHSINIPVYLDGSIIRPEVKDRKQ